MASGVLGIADLAASANTSIYTVPVSTLASFAVNICNRNASPVLVRLAIAATGTPANGEWLFYDVSVDSNSAIERTGLVAGAGVHVVAYSVSANVSVQVYGYEEAA